MKFIIPIIFLLLLLIPLIYAETTFFDNPDDFFITGNLPTTDSGTTGGTTSRGCLTDWTCSSWSSCVDGIQIRNCTKKINYCYVDLKKKPIESQTCSISGSYDSNVEENKNVVNEGNKTGEFLNNQKLYSGNNLLIIFILFLIIAIIIVFVLYHRTRRKKRKSLK